uniref:Uncharacterized protein n=1 Tax=Panagrolaimus sp. JU765 TaxID=591449 RepID=A0AC34RJN7_9BILA
MGTKAVDKRLKQVTLDRTEVLKGDPSLLNDLADFFALSNVPFNVVKLPCFQRLIRIPKENIPNRHQIPNILVKNRAETLQKNHYDKFSSSMPFALAIDEYSSNNQRLFCITASQLSKKMVLNTAHLPLIDIESKTASGENLAQFVKNALEDTPFKLENIAAITRDGGANIIAACRCLEVDS